MEEKTKSDMEIGQDYLGEEEDSGVDNTIYLPGGEVLEGCLVDSIEGNSQGSGVVVDEDSFEDFDDWSDGVDVILPPGAVVVSSDQSDSTISNPGSDNGYDWGDDPGSGSGSNPNPNPDPDSDSDDWGGDTAFVHVNPELNDSSSWGESTVLPPSFGQPNVSGWSDDVKSESESWGTDTVQPSFAQVDGESSESWGTGKPPSILLKPDDGWSNYSDEHMIEEDSWGESPLPPTIATTLLENNDWGDSDEEETNIELFKNYYVQEDENVKGLKARRDNRGMQDANAVYLETPGYAVFAVFDGHGEDGEGCSQALSGMWGETVLPGFIENISDTEKYWDKIYQNIEAQMVRYEFGGSTCTSVIIWTEGKKRYLQCTNVGDSEGFLIRNDSPIPLTEIHRPDAETEMKRLEGILEPGKTRIGGSLAVSRSFGDSFLKDGNTGAICNPYVSEIFLLEDGDTHIILASDGLWDFVSAEEAIQIIRNNPDQPNNPKQPDIAELLLQASKKESKSKDNITVIVVVL